MYMTTRSIHPCDVQQPAPLSSTFIAHLLTSIAKSNAFLSGKPLNRDFAMDDLWIASCPSNEMSTLKAIR